MSEVPYPDTCLVDGVEAVMIGRTIALLRAGSRLVLTGAGVSTLNRLLPLLDGKLSQDAIALKLGVSEDSLRRTLSFLHRGGLSVLSIYERHAARRASSVGVTGPLPLSDIVGRILTNDGYAVVGPTCTGCISDRVPAELEVILIVDGVSVACDLKDACTAVTRGAILLVIDSGEMIVREVQGPQCRAILGTTRRVAEEKELKGYQIAILAATAALVASAALDRHGEKDSDATPITSTEAIARGHTG